MSEMIERVARALAKQDPEFDPNWDYTDAARAAIEAMMPPTEAMLEAAMTKSVGFDDAWKAMITAALEE